VKPVQVRTGEPGKQSAFGPLKRIETGVLAIGYVDVGPIWTCRYLLHGWPYDIHSYADVVPLPTSSGYRVIVPYLRGYGTTTFLSADTPRNGQQSCSPSMSSP
jgi:pimeloyl-ACP methyl ester carboxylesterase